MKRLSPGRRHKLDGSTMVEMVAAVIILAIVIIGVAQYLVVSRLTVYSANIKAGVSQTLKDAMVLYQGMPVPGNGSVVTNVPVENLNASVSANIVKIPGASQSAPAIRITKEREAQAGTYKVYGEVAWQLFPNSDGTATGVGYDAPAIMTYTLHVPQ